MLDDNIKNIADHYGKDAQLGMLQEECAELIQAVSKYRRAGMPLIDDYNHIVEEIADVEIVISQVKHLLKIPDYAVEFVKAEKVSRQIARIKEEKIT
jgi:NTP pyrophosphatase (non-canonical NTP hydrolase)